MDQKNTTILLVLIEDDATIRKSYEYLFDGQEEIQVVNTYSSIEAAAPNLAQDAPDVILLDITLPGISGVDAIPAIKKLLPGVHIVMLTVHEQEEIIFKALNNGAAGYLTKNTPAERILLAIKDVIASGGAMSANVARLVMNSFRKNIDSPLSKRETEVLKHIAEGKSRKSIADELHVDAETIKTHIKNIYHKLDVHSKEEAIRAARENKFI
ncbi:response regulator [Terrimonas rubra]|uniref:Response regulator n=1 Tax=Terrimonas rubra TaxID=1035890 RepID=A0ABW6A3W3_9BACT